MGVMNEEANESSDRDQIIASVLGITLEELNKTGWDGEVYENQSSDDGHVYGYYIEFADNAPREVLAKIAGLRHLTAYLPLGLFAEDDNNFEND